jgi:hypothetical protein
LAFIDDIEHTVIWKKKSTYHSSTADDHILAGPLGGRECSDDMEEISEEGGLFTLHIVNEEDWTSVE